MTFLSFQILAVCFLNMVSNSLRYSVFVALHIYNDTSKQNITKIIIRAIFHMVTSITLQ